MNQRTPVTINRLLMSRLQREWQALNHRRAVLHRARGWRPGVSFESLDELVAAAGYWSSRGDRLAPPAAADVPPAAAESPGNPNAVLGRLLLAARVDDLAARVVLQRLLPGVVARARRWGGHRVGGSADAFDELLSTTWMVIREFPVERRPLHLAANLLRDSEYRAFERASRRMLVHEPTEPHLLDLPVEVAATIDAADELAAVVAGARSLTERDRYLIELLVQGATAAQMAAALHVSERTVRYHRDAVVHRLRAAALAA